MKIAVDIRLFLLQKGGTKSERNSVFQFHCIQQIVFKIVSRFYHCIRTRKKTGVKLDFEPIFFILWFFESKLFKTVKVWMMFSKQFRYWIRFFWNVSDFKLEVFLLNNNLKKSAKKSGFSQSFLFVSAYAPLGHFLKTKSCPIFLKNTHFLRRVRFRMSMFLAFHIWIGSCHNASVFVEKKRVRTWVEFLRRNR